MSFFDNHGKYQRYKEGCFFCNVHKNNIGIFYENRSFYSRLDRYPVSPGHFEIIPNTHVSSLIELDSISLSDLHDALKKSIDFLINTDLKQVYTEFSKSSIFEIDKNSKWYGELEKNPSDMIKIYFANRILKHPSLGKKPDGYNYGINDGLAAGQTIPHLHIHVIPRYIGDVKDPTGGVRNIFPDVGNYKCINALEKK